MYLKSVLRYRLINNELFPTLLSNVEDNYDTVFADSGTYEVNVSYTNADNMQGKYENMLTLTTEMHRFYENMINSTLTREISYDLLSYFLTNV